MITFKKIALKSKAVLILINYTHAILDQEIQNNGGCPEAAGPDRERFLQPRKYQKYPHRSWLGNWLWALSENPGLLLLKYREYLQKLYSLDTWCLTEQTNVLRSDKTSNRISHTACQIWPTMLYISYALINSLTLKTSSISTNSWGPELFKTLQETSYIILGVQIIFHSWFIWCPLDISRAFERITHMTIPSTLKFTNTLPYAWKYHMIDSTELIQKKEVLTGNTQQRSTWVKYFRTKEIKGVIRQKTSLIPSNF